MIHTVHPRSCHPSGPGTRTQNLPNRPRDDEDSLGIRLACQRDATTSLPPVRDHEVVSVSNADRADLLAVRAATELLAEVPSGIE